MILLAFRPRTIGIIFAAYLLTIPDTKAGRGLTFGVDGRRTRIGAFPVSIETATYARLARNAARSPLAKEIGESLDGVVSPPFETMSGALAIAAIVGNAGATSSSAIEASSIHGTGAQNFSRAMASGWTPVSGIAWDRILQAGDVEAAIIAFLLVFNAALGLFQESRAQATLAALKSRLALTPSVKRDGAWKTVPAKDLAPRDLVKLSLGGVVAAGVKLTGGEVLLDQSMLTGELVPIEAGPGLQTYAGALVRRGEAEAEVTTPGVRTTFGRTAELVRTAHVGSTQQKAGLRVVRNLTAFNGGVIMLLLAHSWDRKMPVAEVIPLVLTAILASMPVALPATFSLASALGALGPSRSWASFRPASRPWTKRRRWLSCAPTRPAHACCGRRLRGPGFGEGPSIPTPQDHLRPRHAGERTDEEDQFKRVPRARGGRCRPQKMADHRRPRVQIEGAIPGAADGPCHSPQFSAAASLRLQLLCHPSGVPSHGRRRQRRLDHAGHVRRQSARL
jgi:hypothetical protein